MMIIMSVFFTSCTGFEEVELTEVKELKVLNVSSGKVDFSVNAEIYNPNTFGVTVKGAELDIKLEGIDLGKTKLDESFKVKGNSKEIHQISFNLDISKLSLMSIPKLLGIVSSGGREVNVEVNGTIKGGAFLINKTFPVSVKQKVPLEL
tara:strand:+ start:726 stop:1172 length:447 start_codon:yes stop_codon:yes gene_type:complete